MSSGKDNESIGWMYDGAKSNVNREDYLMGKKIDKNFEKYSDVVNEEKPEAVDRLVHTRTISAVPTGLKTSSLQTDVIRSEDPFVAVRVREETKRREVMDNPLMKLKLQKMLKSMMSSKEEKKKEKKSKSKKKKKRSRSSSSSDSSDEEDDRKSKSRKRSPSPKKARRISDDRTRRGSSPDRKHRRSADDSKRRSVEKRETQRKRSRSNERREVQRKRSRSVEKRETQRRRRSRSDDRSRRRSSREKDEKRGRDDRSHDRERPAHNDRDKRRRESSPDRKPRRSPEKDRNNRERRRRESSSDRPRSSQKEKKTREKSASRSPVSKRRSRSSSWDSADDNHKNEKPTTSSKSDRKYDSHVPEHLRLPIGKDDSGSESEPELRRSPKEEKKMFGLVEMRKRTDEEKEEMKKEPSKKLELVKFSTGRGGGTKKDEPRRKLTDEEKAARLAEMQNNVKWRDEVREKNLAKGRKDDEEEKEEMDQSGYAPSFIRSQMRDACDAMTVEKRLQSTKGGIQRSHGYMDKNFAKK